MLASCHLLSFRVGSRYLRGTKSSAEYNIGRLQAKKFSCNLILTDLFQFLIGRLQALQILILLAPLLSVSIPYRQATGPTTDVKAIKSIKGFQFLIGRLQATKLF